MKSNIRCYPFFKMAHTHGCMTVLDFDSRLSTSDFPSLRGKDPLQSDTDIVHPRLKVNLKIMVSILILIQIRMSRLLFVVTCCLKKVEVLKRTFTIIVLCGQLRTSFGVFGYGA